MNILQDILKTKNVIVCCGCGGVGKTTTSAALGLKAAEMGRKTLVMTIDPAKRLADSLGIGELTNEPKKISLTKNFSGEMWAMMLDVKQTMDAFISEHASSKESVQSILNNPIYQQFSNSLGGGQEYGGMGRLYQIHSSQKYDLLILDTPPSHHAIDFIMAPINFKNFFSAPILQFFLQKDQDATNISTNLINAGSDFAMKVFEKLTGSHFYKDLSEFIKNLQGLYKSFIIQAEAVSSLLANEKTAFLTITSPEKQQLVESYQLEKQLNNFGFRLHLLVVNKCNETVVEENLDMLPENLRGNITELLQKQRKQAEHEDFLIKESIELVSTKLLYQKVPLFHKDIHDLNSLWEYGNCLIKI
ncbi:MAG: ArsA family ATPase [Leptospiraceae bacterium]|nr:ArsA family ATPase [Leptospiraceae bacterium]